MTSPRIAAIATRNTSRRPRRAQRECGSLGSSSCRARIARVSSSKSAERVRTRVRPRSRARPTPSGIRSSRLLTNRDPDEHAGQPLGSARRVAQHPKKPVRLAEVVAQPTKREQPVIGVGAVGEPPSITGRGCAGSWLVAIPRRSERRCAAGRRPDRGTRWPRAAPRPARSTASSPSLGQRCDRGQQRPIEEALVQAAHLVLGAAARPRSSSSALANRPVARASTRTASGSRGIRCVRVQSRQLEPVLHAAAATGSRVRTRPIRRGRCTPGGEGDERRQGRRVGAPRGRAARARAAAAGW